MTVSNDDGAAERMTLRVQLAHGGIAPVPAFIVIVFRLRPLCGLVMLFGRPLGRARIEQMMGKLKRFERVALRCEKAARNVRSIVALAATFVSVRSV